MFPQQESDPTITKFVWAIYLLQLLTPFSMGISLLLSGILAYKKYDESIGTIEESHLRWQIKTFWFGLAGMLIGFVLLLVWIGGFIMTIVWLWIVYRVVKGVNIFLKDKEIRGT